MLAPWNQPVRRGGHVLERLRKTAGASEPAAVDIDAPSVPNGAGTLAAFVPTPTRQLEVVVPA